MKKSIVFGGVLVTVLLLTGCSHKHYGVTYPNHDINDLGKVFVECQTYEKMQFPLVCGDITDEIALLGYDVSKGKKEEITDETKVLVSYVDNWYWDMSMYMIRLEMKVREKATNELIAESVVERTSLIRKNTKEMAREVLSEMVFQSVGERERYLNDQVSINPLADFSNIKKIYIVNSDNESIDLKAKEYILKLGYEVELGHKKQYTDDIDAILVLNTNYETYYWQLRDPRIDRLLAQGVASVTKKGNASALGGESSDAKENTDDLRSLMKMFEKLNK